MSEDLAYLLPAFLLNEGESVSIGETVEIDRCVSDSFETDIAVKKEPEYENLCKFTTFYP